MRSIRLPFVMVYLIASAALAIAARQTVHAAVVVPLAYAAWRLGILFHSVPQLVRWAALVVIVVLMIAWQMVPQFGRRSEEARPLPSRGQVETLVVWLRRARRSNYFKWQLANRLGRAWQRICELTGRHPFSRSSTGVIEGFLASGLQRSFVDFPSRRWLMEGGAGTPLDVDPSEVVAFLESQL